MRRFAGLVAGAALTARRFCRAQAPLDPAKLLNPGTDSWPTYNGDYSGRRFSTLTKINANNVGALSLAWMYRLNTGGAPAVGSSGTIKATPLQINGVLYFSTPDHVWAVDARTGPGDLALPLEIVGRQSPREPRRRGAGRLAVLRNARRQPRLAEHQGRHRTLAQADCRSEPVLLRLGGAGHRQEPRHRRRERRRSRHPRLPRVARSGDRRSPVALVRSPAEERGSRVGDVAERRDGAAWRRHDVAADHLRSRAEPDLRDHRQPAAGDRAQEPPRQQSLHRLDRGAQPRHRQDGLVLPVVAARHARLGLDPDRRPHRRRDQRPAA